MRQATVRKSAPDNSLPKLGRNGAQDAADGAWYRSLRRYGQLPGPPPRRRLSDPGLSLPPAPTAPQRPPRRRRAASLPRLHAASSLHTVSSIKDASSLWASADTAAVRILVQVAAPPPEPLLHHRRPSLPPPRAPKPASLQLQPDLHSWLTSIGPTLKDSKPSSLPPRIKPHKSENHLTEFSEEWLYRYADSYTTSSAAGIKKKVKKSKSRNKSNEKKQSNGKAKQKLHKDRSPKQGKIAGGSVNSSRPERRPIPDWQETDTASLDAWFARLPPALQDGSTALVVGDVERAALLAQRRLLTAERDRLAAARRRQLRQVDAWLAGKGAARGKASRPASLPASLSSDPPPSPPSRASASPAPSLARREMDQVEAWLAGRKPHTSSAS